MIKITVINTHETNPFYDSNEWNKYLDKEELVKDKTKRDVLYRSNKDNNEANKIQNGYINDLITDKDGDVNYFGDKCDESFDSELLAMEMTYFLYYEAIIRTFFPYFATSTKHI